MKMISIEQIKLALAKEEGDRAAELDYNVSKRRYGVAHELQAQVAILRQLRNNAEEFFSEDATEGGDKDGKETTDPMA